MRQKLYNNDSILEQTVRQSIAEIAAIKAARDRDVMQLETQVEELQQELWEKSRFFQTAELELSDEVHYLLLEIPFLLWSSLVPETHCIDTDFCILRVKWTCSLI